MPDKPNVKTEIISIRIDSDCREALDKLIAYRSKLAGGEVGTAFVIRNLILDAAKKISK